MGIFICALKSNEQKKYGGLFYPRALPAIIQLLKSEQLSPSAYVTNCTECPCGVTMNEMKRSLNAEEGCGVYVPYLIYRLCKTKNSKTVKKHTLVNLHLNFRNVSV